MLSKNPIKLLKELYSIRGRQLTLAGISKVLSWEPYSSAFWAMSPTLDTWPVVCQLNCPCSLQTYISRPLGNPQNHNLYSYICRVPYNLIILWSLLLNNTIKCLCSISVAVCPWSIVFFHCRVSDPHWFNADPDTDPDPAFFLIADPDSGSGSRIRIQGLMT